MECETEPEQRSIKILFESEKGLLRIVRENNKIKLQQPLHGRSGQEFIDICETHLEEQPGMWAKEYRLHSC
tara:strand:- start:10284 stop:10496 length:213 start_codon:yes stop_codon:yes gene_type:complete